MEIERSRLPCDVQFPRVGEIWTVVRDCYVAFRPLFGGAEFAWRPSMAIRFIDGGLAQLSKGEVIRVLGPAEARPVSVRFSPVRYDELHASIVPEETRKLPGYRGYELQVKTAKTVPDFSKGSSQTYFTEAFRLLANAS
jgi:hypothetical protein